MVARDMRRGICGGCDVRNSFCQGAGAGTVRYNTAGQCSFIRVANFVKGPAHVQFLTLRGDSDRGNGTLILSKGPVHLLGGRRVGDGVWGR